MISMAEGFWRATHSIIRSTCSSAREACGFPIRFLWPRASQTQLTVDRSIASFADRGYNYSMVFFCGTKSSSRDSFGHTNHMAKPSDSEVLLPVPYKSPPADLATATAATI